MNNLNQFYGLSGAPLIEAIVERIKMLGLKNPILIIIVTILLAFGFNLLLGVYLFGYDFKSVISVTLLTAITTNLYHEATKPEPK